MEINQDAQLDIIHQLIQRDLIFIVEEIFSFLDFSSLIHCECVSKDWNLAIRNGRSWQKIYNKESKKNPVFHTALLRYGEHEVSKCQIENDQFPSQFPFKRLFHTRQKIKENWGVGKYSTTILKIGKVRVTCHVMDEKRIALALVPEDYILPVIKVVNRWTLKIECVLTGSVEKRNIIYLQLYGDMIFGGYKNGTITAWNITTRQIIHQFQDQTVDSDQFVQVLFHAAGCLFVSSTQFVSIFGIHSDTHITIRRIVSPEEMVIDNTLVFPSSKVLQFDSIPNYFVLFFRNVSFKGRLQLRSEVDFQVVRGIDLESESPIFSYTNGLLVTIERSIVYTFWDPETLHKMFLFKAAFDNYLMKYFLPHTI
uniref:F-box domain-containing protein n=1 Tax=Daphnia galeata TaxID=27404 RepID=A0A8J2RWK3_9CRUS|nr:unnamed protein product [Daphnia galeata]